MLTIMTKADQLGLFEKIVPVAASLKNDGTYTPRHFARRKVRLPETEVAKPPVAAPKPAKVGPVVADLFAAPPEKVERAAPKTRVKKVKPVAAPAVDTADKVESAAQPPAPKLADPVADLFGDTPQVVKPAREPAHGDYSVPFSQARIPAWGVPAGTSKDARRRINAEAVAIMARGTAPTAADRVTLRQYSGAGGIGDSLNEFYTDPAVATAVWYALRRLGLPIDASVLEPSCATGVFIATAPADVQVTGVEMDPTSASIGAALHGRHEVVNASLERFARSDARTFDGVIGNAPFGLRGSLLKDDKPKLSTAENYFLDTSLDKTRDGGIVAMIVPTGVVDGKNNRAFRENLLRKGEFLGALRMPNTAFEHSHTGVTTDVIFLKKRPQDVAGALGTLTRDQLQLAGAVDPEFVSGEYFTGSGAGKVLGTMTEGWRAKAGMGHDITVEGSMAGVPDEIAAFVPRTGRAAITMQSIMAALQDDETAKAKAISGALKVPYATGRAGDTKMVDGIEYVLQGSPLRWHRVDEIMQTPAVTEGQEIANRIEGLLSGDFGIREAVEADLRSYIGRHGNPSKNPEVLLAAGTDKLLYRLIGAVKPDGSFSDVITGARHAAPVESSFESAATALALESGDFTPQQVAARWHGGDAEAALDHLYASPEFALNPDGTWTSLDAYLSGELWPKLDAARGALAGDVSAPDRAIFERQAAALEKTIDPKILEDVEVNINSAFLPLRVLEAFFNERIDAQNARSSYQQQRVSITFGDGIYTITGGWIGNIEKYLNRTGVRKDDLPAILRTNKEFKDWLCQSSYRDEVEDLYNRSFRGFRQMEFSETPFDIPGLNPEGLKSYTWSGLRWALAAGKGIIAADVGLGKAQPLTAKILTPSGWREMGEMMVGDEVIAGDGTVTHVTGVFPQGEKEIFRVGFHDGSSTECCDEHLWLTQSTCDRNNARRGCGDGGAAKVRPLSEIRGSLRYLDREKNHTIPMVGYVEFPPRPVPIDPYLFGMLLGDGGLGGRTPRLSNAEEAVIEGCRSGLPDGMQIRRETGSEYDYYVARTDVTRGVNVVGKAIADLGVNCLSYTKFVPDVYKFNCPEIRMQVLQGLMDADGFVDAQGVTVQFCSVSERLAKDVQFIVQSFGGNATIKSRITHYTHKGEYRDGARSYLVHMRLPPEINPFLHSKKRLRVRPKSKYLPTRYITSVDSVGMKPAQCISVAHHSHLYVTDDFVVTHNTVRGLLLAKMAVINGQAKKPIIVIPKSVGANWLKEAERWFPGSRCLLIGETFTTDKDGKLKGSADSAAERNRKYHDLTQNDYDFIFITQPAWNDLDLDPITKGEYAEQDFWVQRGTSLGNAGDKRINKIRESHAQAIAKREFQNRSDAIYFNDLGVDMIIADEMHADKNLYAARNRFGETPKFLGGQGLSNRALDMFFKAKWLRSQNGGRNVYGLTATPTKNSPLEIYSMLSFIAPEAFEKIGIRNSEEFLDRFCVFRTENILGTDGNIQEALVTVGFKNMTELRAIMRRYIDRKTAAEVGLKLPERDDRMHLVDMSPEQQAVYVDLRIRAAESAGKRDAGGDAHIFSIMSDMGKAAMDLELYNPAAYAGADSPKYAEAADHIIAGAKEGGQVVFADSIGTHRKLADKLAGAGIPRERIAIMNAQEAPTAAARQNIADAFNAGKLDVVIGNTATMGEGQNLQTRTTDIHHLDLPWEPASMQQRNGRGLRQGNLNEAIRIHTYLSKGSFDGYKYQSMTAKKDWMDLLWNGGDRIENLSREGAVSHDDMMIMLAADPEAAKKQYAENRAAAEARFKAQQNAEVSAEFARLQGMRASLAGLKNKETLAGQRLGVQIARARLKLEDNPAFVAKDTLDRTDAVIIHPQTGLAFHDGVQFDIPAGDGAPVAGGGKFVVTSVDSSGSQVWARRYGSIGHGQVHLSVEELNHVTAAAPHDAEAEKAEIATAVAADASGKVHGLKDFKDVVSMPAATLRQHYDLIQKQMKAGAADYSFTMPHGDVAMVGPGGDPVVHASYEARRQVGDHDFMLPVPEHQEKAIEAYIVDEMAKRFAIDHVPVPRTRSGKTEPRPGVQYPGKYDQKSNRWVGPGKEVFGGAFGATARKELERRQYAVARKAPTLTTAVSDLLPLATMDGYSSITPKWPHKALVTLWAKATQNGALHSKLAPHLPTVPSRYGDAKQIDDWVFNLNDGRGGWGGRKASDVTVADALITMAKHAGHTALAEAMQKSAARTPEMRNAA